MSDSTRDADRAVPMHDERAFGCDERGMTLAEVLVATFIITIGLLAVLTAFPFAMSGVETGKQQSTATFLAEQQLENFRTAQVTDPTMTTAMFNLGSTTEAYGTIANGYTKYQRVTTVAAGPTATTKRITVAVSYRPSVTVTNTANPDRTVSIATVLSTRE
jgi:prepilin-type N-terminal cleavage/methylation domain-containing protein